MLVLLSKSPMIYNVRVYKLYVLVLLS
jgi:hypothetical protein